MKNKLLPLLFVLGGGFAGYSQVGIGTTMPNSSAQLEVVATDKGVLIPRVQLTGSTDVRTIKNGNVSSLLVFNTATASDITPGYYYWYDNRWNRVVTSNEITATTGAVIYNPTNQQFNYVDKNGNQQVIDFTQIIKANETITTLVNNGAASYTYTSENNSKTTIDVVGDVVTNASSIFNNPAVTNIIQQISEKAVGNVTFDSVTNKFSYVDAKGVSHVININDIVKLNETITTLTNNGAGSYTYKNESGADSDINVVKDVIDNSSTIFNNTEVKKDITTLIESKQTITTLINNNNGTYDYTNEDNLKTTINVVGDVVANASSIFNNPAVTNIIQQISEKAEGNVTFNSTTNEFSYVDAAGNTQLVNIKDIVKLNETLTSLVKGTDGKYVYTDEKAGTATIDVVQDVIDNSSTIFNNSAVKTEVTNLVESEQTITTLVNNNNGTYLYTSEDKTPTTIDVIGDVITNASTIFNNPAVTNIIQQISEKAEGNVTFNSTTNEFSYVDAAGNTQLVDISKIVKDNETLTSLVKGTDGKYVYTDEKAGTATIDVVQDVIDNSSTIFNNSAVKTEVTNLIESEQTVTTLVNNNDGTYLYTSEDKTPTTINVVGDVITNASTIFNNPAVTNIIQQISEKAEGNVTFNSTTNEFSYVDAAGNTQLVDISKIVKDNETLTSLVKGTDGKYVYTDEKAGIATIDVVQDVIDNSSTIFNNSAVKTEVTNLIESEQTITTLVNNNDGTYLYTSEDKTPTTINVVGDVITNASTIFNNPAVTNIIQQISEKAEGNVTFNSTTNEFSYVDAAGNTQLVDISKIVKDNETLTSLVKGTDGKYVYTDEKAGTATIDVVQDVIDNSSTIFNNSAVKTEVTNLIESEQTVTTLVNNNDGTYLYTSEDKTPTTIDVVGDVITNASTIFNNPAVTNIIQEIAGKAAGDVTFNSTTNEFSYVDAAGNTQLVDISKIVKDNETLTSLVKGTDGKYVYTDEKAGTATIDVVQDVIDNSSTIFNDPKVINELTTIVKDKETVTSLKDVVTQETDIYDQQVDVHTLTYTDETGTATPIDLSLLVKGTETLTSLTYDGTTQALVYKDEKGNESDFNLVDLVGPSQTLTSLVVNSDKGTLDYTDEDKATHPLDLTDAIKEPWFSVASKKGATLNTDDVYTQGWVGIGFDTPSAAPNEKLRVNGAITTVNSYYADYVFEDYFKGFSDIKSDYKFKQLAEVDAYIKKNKHLPGITPISELVKTKEGYSFNMSELSIQLLEKTEELYLHVIEQEKELEVKNNEIQQLKAESAAIKAASAAMNVRLEKLEKLVSDKQ
ncbi:beta strand repeat-containing protein [Flavobacterium sp. N2038]|uniref:beta strand repeat-containing protein n=1 Tax=Flavobacterium sp. N2038 TaxID=2986829 RepID=UPI0022245281|nr:hypothetical protein [Flavobacterium sp. N2038]